MGLGDFLGGLASDIGDIGKDLGPLAGPIGSIGATALGGLFQQHANTATANMASTQYQRGVADLKAAGLNPAMAYGGASDAPATMQPAVTAQAAQSGVSGAIDAYNQIVGGQTQRRLQSSQATAADTQAYINSLQADTMQPAALAGTSADYQNAWKQGQMAGFSQSQTTAQNLPGQFKAQIANTNAQTATAQSQARLNDAMTTLNEQQFTNDWFRKNIQPWVNSTASTLKPISQAVGTFGKY